MIYYAKILIAVSIAILVYGLVLDINNNVRLIDPEENTKVINDNNGNYTSVDSNNNDGSNIINGNPDSNSNPNSPQTNVIQWSDANNALREDIQNKYNISIKYGSETEGYVVGGLSTVSIYDDYTITIALNNLDKVLSLYPYGLFSERFI